MTSQFHTTVTERIGFRDCRRRWWYEVVERLARRDAIAWNLWIGDLTHYALEQYYVSQRDLTFALDQLAHEFEQRDAALANEYRALYDLGLGQEAFENFSLVRDLLTHYDEYDKRERFFDEILQVNVEDRSFVPIRGGRGRLLRTRPLLSGRIDLVVGRRDGIWIVDHKTAQAAPSFSALDVDDQLTGYCYVYWRAFGEVPRGALYNVLIKRLPEPPRVLANGSLSRDKAQATTYALYLDALRERGISDLTPYQEILEALSVRGYSQYFARDGSTRTQRELESFERRVYWEYRDMRDALSAGVYHPFVYPNPTQRTCQTCSVETLCHAHEKGDDVEWIKGNSFTQRDPRVEIPLELRKESNAT